MDCNISNRLEGLNNKRNIQDKPNSRISFIFNQIKICIFFSFELPEWTEFRYDSINPIFNLHKTCK